MSLIRRPPAPIERNSSSRSGYGSPAIGMVRPSRQGRVVTQPVLRLVPGMVVAGRFEPGQLGRGAHHLADLPAGRPASGPGGRRLGCTSRLPTAVPSAGPATTGRPVASAVRRHSSALRAPPPTTCTTSTSPAASFCGHRAARSGGRRGRASRGCSASPPAGSCGTGSTASRGRASAIRSGHVPGRERSAPGRLDRRPSDGQTHRPRRPAASRVLPGGRAPAEVRIDSCEQPQSPTLRR